MPRRATSTSTDLRLDGYIGAGGRARPRLRAAALPRPHRLVWPRGAANALRRPPALGPPAGDVAIAGSTASTPSFCRSVNAVLTSATWVNACGKLPTWRPRRGRTPPRAARGRCAAPSSRSNSSRASSSRPCRARSSASQNVQARNAPSPGGRPSTRRVRRRRSAGRSRPRRARARSPRPCRRTRGSVARQEPDQRDQQQARVEPSEP